MALNSDYRIYYCTSLSGEELEYPAGLRPSELVPGLDQTLVDGVLLQARDLVALAVAETGTVRISGNDDVRPVAAAAQRKVIRTELKEKA